MEVLHSWVDDLNAYSKKQVLDIFTDLLMEGCVSHQNVQRVYELAYRIRKATDERKLDKWVTDLKCKSEAYLLKHTQTIAIPELYNSQLFAYMHTYAETVTYSGAISPAFVDALLEYLKILEEHQFNGK